MAIGATIPAKLIQRIIPLLMKQTEQLSKFVSDFTNRIMQLNSKTRCSDPKIKQLKIDLEKILQQINTIKQGLNSINNIVPVITTVSGIAQALKTIQLAIPSVPGVPTGPVTELINTFDSLGKNAKSSVSSLQGMVSAINIQFARINQSLAKAIRKLSAICNTEIFDVSTDINDALLNLEYTDDVPTQFYTELNVSDEDITSRLSLIEQLVTEQLNVLQNLKEAPSKVLSGIQTPITDIGDIGDYYIDTDSQLIYGPKTELGWGSGINI